MKRRISMTVLMLLFGAGFHLAGGLPTAEAQNPYGIRLNPGERLVAVNGVPVSSSTARPVNQSPTRPVTAAASTGGSMYSGTDQQRAQAEADYMARNGIKGHVGGQIGSFEGCGWSSGGMPGTCTPGTGMTLTADAIAHGRDGVYRVRAWR